MWGSAAGAGTSTSTSACRVHHHETVRVGRITRPSPGAVAGGGGGCLISGPALEIGGSLLCGMEPITDGVQQGVRHEEMVGNCSINKQG